MTSKAKKTGGGQAVDAPRGTFFWMSPDDLVVIGLDTKDGEEHPLYDVRVHLPPDDATVKNMMVYGVIKAVAVVKMDDGRVAVLDGRRRVINAREASDRLEKQGESRLRVKVIFGKGEDDFLFKMSRAANAGVLLDGPIVNARNAQRMIQRGATVEEAAVTFGVKKKTMEEWLSLLDLLPKVRKEVEKGVLAPSAAAELAKLPKAEQEQHLDEVIAKGEKPTTERMHNKVREAKGKESATTPKTRIEKAVKIFLANDNPGALAKAELVEILDKVCKVLTGKTIEKLAAAETA